MTGILDFEIAEVIYDGDRSTVQRGRERATGRAVVLKELSLASANEEDLARYRYALELTHDLKVEGICAPFMLFHHDNRPVLVMDDIGGVSLGEGLRTGRLDLGEGLRVAIQIAKALGGLHAHDVMHLDVNPANIVRNPATGQAVLIDFDLASRLDHESNAPLRLSRPRGTLAYIAPEQTGRTNRSVDRRADLYSLGVTLFELFTGRLPFPHSDPLTLVHHHLAVAPPSPHGVEDSVPEGLSQVILRLLEKMPEDRYQTAEGVLADLLHCEGLYRETGDIPAFELGRADLTDHLRLSQRLYGRDADKVVLLDAFGRARNGGTELLMIGGYSGVGKSSLVNEVHGLILEARGRYADGKYEQLRREPYLGLLEALRALVDEILSLPSADIALWRRSLLEAVGTVGQAVIDVIPEVELVLGPQPPLPALGHAEAQNRFQRVLARFIAAFARADQPLVLFLDDLQWSDSNTLGLLKLLLEDADTANLLVIGTYRSNEVSPAHPVGHFLRQVRKGAVSLTERELAPLGESAVGALVADSLRRTQADVEPLVAAIMARTGGNPFFVDALLLTLAEQGAVWLDRGAGRWEWSLERVEELGISDNVADLMVRGMARLAPETADLLQVAASIGATFELPTLAAAAERSPAQTAALLWPALRENLVEPMGARWRYGSLSEDGVVEGVGYRFCHDRIQEAAYDLLAPERQAERHLRIGRVLLDRGGAEDDFGIVDQLDLGRSLVVAEDERVELARRNLAASRRAMRSAAYSLAHRYLHIARELLPADAWQRVPDLSMEVLRAHADASIMCGEYDETADLVDILSVHARGLAQQVDAVSMRIQVLIQKQDREGLIATAMHCLGMLGIEPPADEAAWGALHAAEGAAVLELLQGVDVATLVDRPAMTDPDALAQMRLLGALAPFAVSFMPIVPVVFPRMVRLSLDHGNSPLSPSGYVFYGFLRGLMGDWPTGDAFGQMALALNEAQGLPQLRPPTEHVYACFLAHWRHSMAMAAAHCRNAMVTALESGIFTTAGWAGMNLPWLGLAGGHNLDELVQETRELQSLARSTLRYTDAVTSYDIVLRAMARLVGARDELDTMDADGRSLPELRERLAHYPMAQVASLASHLQVAVVMGDLATAGPLAQDLAPRLSEAAGLIAMPEVIFLAALTLCDLSRVMPAAAWAEQAPRLEELAGHVAGAAQLNPGVRGWQYELLQAERAAMAGEADQARRAYDAAIGAAEASMNPYAEGLCLERAFRFLESQGLRRMGLGYLTDARYAYVRWGARAKVEALEASYPVLRGRRAITTSTVTTTSSGSLEVETVLRATRAISSEHELEPLLERVVQVVLEHAGAQRGYLVIDHQGRLCVDASGDGRGVRVHASEDIADVTGLCEDAVRYVARSGTAVIEDDARVGRFRHTAYVLEHRPRSLLVLPLQHLGKVVGVLYLENNLGTGAFVGDHLELLHTVAVQAATSIENARLVLDLKQRSQQLELRSAELEEKNQQLTELDQLRDDFLAKTSHELRTPLHGIIGLAQSLMVEGAAQDHAHLQHCLGMIASSGQRLSNLVNDILDLSTLERREIELQLAPVEIGGIVQSVLALARPLLRSDAVAMVADISDPGLAVLADAQRVEQILFNLIGNAAKFTETGSIVASVRAQGDRVSVSVQDTGIGIRPAVLTRIFEAFEQGEAETARQFGGTGLGLSVAKELVELHGGTLTVESEPGQGSTFTFTLRRAEAPVVAVAEDGERKVMRALVAVSDELLTVAPSAGERRKARVLVVDDEPVNLQVALNQLGRAGYEVYTARSGPEALRRLEGGLRPHLVLLDLMMHGMDGYQVCAEIRKTYTPSELPIIMLTARSQLADLVKGLREGVNDYVVKPFSSEELLARMRNHIQLSAIHRAVGRFVPYGFMTLLGRESIVDVNLGDCVKRDMSVMFADIRGFTSLTGNMSPEDSFGFINEFLGAMEPLVHEHGGFVDKFIGDGIMALFDRSADDAVKAGVAMQRALALANAPRIGAGKAPVRIGIGVNSGPTMVGTVGGPRRMDTTVVSDTVNVASRVEGLNKAYGSGLLLTEHTLRRLQQPEALHLRRLEGVVVRGKVEPVDVFEVLDGLPEEVLERRFATLSDFELGVGALLGGNLAAARRAFSRCADADADDPVVRHFLGRCWQEGEDTLGGAGREI